MSKTVQVLNRLPIVNGMGTASSALKMLMEAHNEYQKVAAQEETKRQAIEAWKEVRLTELHNQKELLRIYLEETFQERRYMIDGLFKILDKGIETGNMDTVNMAISGIINISQHSPLRQIDNLMLSLKNDDVKVIEF